MFWLPGRRGSKSKFPTQAIKGDRFCSSVPKLEDDFWVFKYLSLSLYHLCCCWHSSGAWVGPGVKGRLGDTFFKYVLGDIQRGPWLLPCFAQDTPKISRGQMLFLRFSLKAALWPPRNLVSLWACFWTAPAFDFCSSRKLGFSWGWLFE